MGTGCDLPPCLLVSGVLGGKGLHGLESSLCFQRRGGGGALSQLQSRQCQQDSARTAPGWYRHVGSRGPAGCDQGLGILRHHDRYFQKVCLSLCLVSSVLGGGNLNSVPL